MSKSGKGTRVDPLLISTILSDTRHRRILSLVANEPGPMTERDLAIELAALEERTPPGRVTDDERERRRIDLYHCHLPKLESAGLVVRSGAGIRLVPRFPIDLDAFDISLPSPDRPDDPRWDVIAAFVARPYRRDVVELVADRTDPLSLEDLSERLVAEGADGAVERPDTLRLRLHHVDLPKLDAVDVVSYDASEQQVRPGRALTAVL
ncbi:hypothetical protein ACFQGE_13400 [Halomicroarcula sp. GCM10025817]|uniref:DUF7344 domain-containing protein n=1 Tax=Haloarcula TaxID=2237 RepID=UPI0023E8A068|nr:hypothetical protein [Halomicroarcula sp. SYNS111]